MLSYPNKRYCVEGQRYTNQHLAQKLEHLKNKFEIEYNGAKTDAQKWQHRRQYLVSQIIWMREGELIRNDIYRDFGIL
jgi:hypothetical protein